ncbi:MAG: deoxyribose-phosphate aldolase [Spirochaetales bacterium]|uniref:Deoxyribose-phosphate aldolase n=1 Tax=Candidatus Thalassospirochaeta sargassi TaxID=3119039 RepID=A0AAJ1IAX7_9SPIO|nr:deoxyribose-phosphate aldolase [Spirochaetales bacterium]
MLKKEDFAAMTDLACVKTNTTIKELEKMTELANRWDFIGIYALPAHNEYIKQRLKADSSTFIGGAVGFPSGGISTAMKIRETRELIGFGCGEIDMVINQTWLKAGMEKEYTEDIAGVVKAAGGKIVKVIIEVGYLTDEEIYKASKLAAEAGASFIKTATGWPETGADFNNIKIIDRALSGTGCGIKAAGGIRDAETAVKMIELGATRFGCSLGSAEAIIESL